MKHKRLIISLVLFFFIIIVETYAVTYPGDVYKRVRWDNTPGGTYQVDDNGELKDPDLNYYVVGGTFGTGHDLTIAISQPLAKVSIYLLPIFFFSVFVFGVYYFIKPFVKYPEWVFIMAPATLLTTILAQIFSVGLFWFVLGFYFRDKKHPQRRYKIAIMVFLFLTSLAHFWSGICIVLAFAAFLVIDKKPKLIYVLTPALVLIISVALMMGFTPIRMFDPTTFVRYAPETIPTFFYLFTRGMGFLISASVGILWLLIKKEYSLLKIIVPLLVVPIGMMLVLPYDWVWRLFYFMPLLALTSIFLSYAQENKDKEKRKKQGVN